MGEPVGRVPMIIPQADNDGNRGSCAKLESVNAFVTIIEGLEILFNQVESDYLLKSNRKIRG